MKHVDNAKHSRNNPKKPHQGHPARPHRQSSDHRPVPSDNKPNYEIEGSVECGQAQGHEPLQTATLHLSGSFVVDGVIHYLQPAELE